MKILMVCSKYEVNEKFSLVNNFAFIHEQSESLKRMGIEIDFFMVEGKGIKGYLKSLKPLKDKVKSNHYDIIHAYYGLCGMLAVLQRHVPVVISFLGSDIHYSLHRFFSKIAMRFSAYDIFVEKKLSKKAGAKRKYAIIPFGVDLETFTPIDKKECRKKLGLDAEMPIILFCSSAYRKVKNFPLAEKAVNLIGGIKLMQLRGGYSRQELNLVYNAADVLLMTSFTEGSPQVIKEAMACNCPIVSTDVGDVKNAIGNTRGCYITSYRPDDVAEKIKAALQFGTRTHGRTKIIHLDFNIIAKNIADIYCQTLSYYNGPRCLDIA